MATGGVSDLDRGTDETFDFLCSMCQGQNKNTEGEHFCADCSDYYCSTCIKVHDVVPALKNHKILNKAQFKTLSSVHFPAVPTERCRVHGHKPVDMFCQQHDSVGCATCMVVQHSDCKEKFYVPDYVKNNTTAVNPNTITVQMDALANNVAELLKEFIKQKEYLENSKEKSLKQIQKWRIELNGLLDELENKTIQALEQRFQSLTDKIETVQRELQDSTTDIQSAQDSLKAARGNMAQMFITIKTANEVACLVQEKVNRNQSQVSSTDISFEPHLKLLSLLKEMQALGDISLIENLQSKSTNPFTQITNIKTSETLSKSQSATTSLTPVTKTPTRQQSNECQSKPAGQDSLQQTTKTQSHYTSSTSQAITDSLLQATKVPTSQRSYESLTKPSLLQVKGKKGYTVKVKSDSKTCNIVSACTLADGTIILADDNNRKLKRVNSQSYTVTDYCEVPGLPYQVCAITDQEVAVSCGFSKLIQFVSIEMSGLKLFFSIGSTMQKTRKINTGFSCYALAYADGKLFVSDDNTSVYVYSVSGDRLQQFSKDQSGQQRFSDIRSLAVSIDHSMIYVADYYNDFIILDRTGQLVGQFNGPELKVACSVFLFKNDNVLVCGFDSKNVLQFSSDGKLLGEVLTYDEPGQAVCCNKDNTKLIVGQYGDEIEVYDIN